MVQFLEAVDLRRIMAGMKNFKVLIFLALSGLLFLFGCQDSTGPVVLPQASCTSAAELHPGAISISKHTKHVQLMDSVVNLPEIKWLSGTAVRKFFGDKEFKLVFSQEKQMYLVTYGPTDEIPTVTKISHNDENVNGTVGSINSPLFSADGSKIVF